MRDTVDLDGRDLETVVAEAVLVRLGDTLLEWLTFFSNGLSPALSSSSSSSSCSSSSSDDGLKQRIFFWYAKAATPTVTRRITTTRTMMIVLLKLPDSDSSIAR